jgi:hypothetical protein
MKNLNKFKELLQSCEKNPDKYFALQIKEKGANLIGITQKTLMPFSALVIKREQQGKSIFGFLDGNLIRYSSIQDFNFADEIFVGVDCRKDNNYKIYYRINKDIEDFNKVTSKTELNTDESILIYWEEPQMACMTFCCFDRLRNENIREVITATSESMKRFLKGVTVELISQYNDVNEKEDQERTAHV